MCLTPFFFQDKIVKPRSVAVKFAPSNAKKSSWKPIKSKEPDCATYKVDRGRKFLDKSPEVYRMSRITTSNSPTNMKENNNGSLSTKP